MKPTSKLFFILLTVLGLLTNGSSVNAAKKKSSTSYEISGDVSYVGDAKMRIGDVQLGDVNEQCSSLQAVQSSEISNGNLLRLGAGWQRFSFGLPDAAPLPNTLQSAYAVLGADIEIADSWLLRVETYPGVYSDFTDISGDDVNSPFIIGATYLASEDLQWIMGVSINARRDIPIIPGAGVRWKFANQWTLDFILPRPRIEYEYNDNLTLYAGGEIKSDTYTVSENFGSSHGRPPLNNAEVDYTEGRIGAGLSWKLNKAISVDLDAGAMVYRDFDFHEANQSMHEDSIAPYGQVAIKAGF
jgi:hypothetical protein